MALQGTMMYAPSSRSSSFRNKLAARKASLVLWAGFIFSGSLVLGARPRARGRAGGAKKEKKPEAGGCSRTEGGGSGAAVGGSSRDNGQEPPQQRFSGSAGSHSEQLRLSQKIPESLRPILTEKVSNGLSPAVLRMLISDLQDLVPSPGDGTTAEDILPKAEPEQKKKEEQRKGKEKQGNYWPEVEQRNRWEAQRLAKELPKTERLLRTAYARYIAAERPQAPPSMLKATRSPSSDVEDQSPEDVIHGSPLPSEQVASVPQAAPEVDGEEDKEDRHHLSGKKRLEWLKKNGPHLFSKESAYPWMP
ncbi:unnamed protein product [Amoebophrya sp. A25]|nr:unnamed protein product [Amoebophrya sp. A25]|eukprot:GSA25T00023980001.1